MDKRQRLLELIDIFKLPITKKEAETNVKSFSDEEVNLLVETYEDILAHQDAVTEVVASVDPSTHEHLTKEYNQKVEEAESKYLKDLEVLRTKHDDEMDKVEEEAARQIDESVKKNDTELQKLEEAHDDLYTRLNKAASIPKDELPTDNNK